MPRQSDREGPAIPFYLRIALRLFASPDDRHAVISDLHELYERQLSSHGAVAARSWLQRQARQYVLRLPVDWLLGLGSRKPHRQFPPRHSAGGVEAWGNFLRELRHATRALPRSPMFAMTVVVTVGLGTGGTAAMFSLVNSILLEPLPYESSDRLWRLYTAHRENRWPFSVADYLAFAEEQTSFEAIAAYRTRAMTIDVPDGAQRVSAREVTPGYFSLLGITPILGRPLIDADGVPGASHSTLVSHGFWQRYLEADSAAIGRTIRLDGVEYTIAGVLPAHLGPLNRGTEVFPALQLAPPSRRGPFFLIPLGRLREGVSSDMASAELSAINRALFPVWQDSYSDRESTWRMMGLKEFVVGDVGASLAVALGAVLFLLLIASTNTANLLLARITRRRDELAVRVALGASRRDLVRHLSAESLLLGGVGAAVGFLCAYGGMSLVATFGSDFLPRTGEIGFTPRVIAFFMAVVSGSVLLFGLAPAVGAIASMARSHHGTSGGRSTAAVRSLRLRRVLVGSQFAISVPLLVGAGLLITSLARLNRVDPGFDTTNVVTARVSLPAATYAPQALPAFWNAVTSRIAGLPRVTSVAISVGRPPQQYPFSNNQNLLDKPTPPGESQISLPWNAVTPEYFDVLGVPVLRGRMFRDNDSLAVLVDEAWADRFYPEGNVIGKRFTSGGCDGERCARFEVIGVVGNVKYTGVENTGEGTVYMNFDRFPNWSAFLVLRTAQDPSSILPSVRETVRRVDPSVPLSDVATIDELMWDALQAPRYLTWLVAGFGTVALLLSTIGIYGVMAYFVQAHARDIGIRLALGGRPMSVGRLIIGRGMGLVFIGVGFGLGGAVVVSRYIDALLYEVAPADPTTLLMACTSIIGLAFLACVVPAHHATRTDPVKALRGE